MGAKNWKHWDHLVKIASHPETPRCSELRLSAGLVVELHEELAALRERAERAERERDDARAVSLARGEVNNRLRARIAELGQLAGLDAAAAGDSSNCMHEDLNPDADGLFYCSDCGAAFVVMPTPAGGSEVQP